MMTRPEQFRQIAEDIAKLYEVKDAAYGDSFSDTYNKLGVVSAATRITDKCNRFCRLVTSPHIDDLGESIEDTLKDMAAYCIMTVMALNKKDVPESHPLARMPEESYSVDGVAGLKVDDNVLHYFSENLEPRKRCIKEIIIHGPMIKILFWDAGWYCTMNVDKMKTELIKEKDETKL